MFSHLILFAQERKSGYNEGVIILQRAMPNSLKELEAIASRLRALSLISTTTAGSGHPSSSLSAADLMAALMFGGFFRFQLNTPRFANNDRLLFSKGHASPLFYALWVVAGAIPERSLTHHLREFDSPLEGHPSMRFPFTEAATGSLGQGLSIGVGMALAAKLDLRPYRTFVLLGDSEMAEGSVWEAMMLGKHYKLDNLIGIIDVNRLGQRGETMMGHDIADYKKKIEAFGWRPLVVDGHDLPAIKRVFQKALRTKKRPTMIIAKTLKGKGVPQIQNQEGWHGKPLSKEELVHALHTLWPIDANIRGRLATPPATRTVTSKLTRRVSDEPHYPSDVPVSTRKAYGNALARIASAYPEMVVLDAEVSNSTYSEIFQKQEPKRFFEMYIAEQNMVGAALGLSRQGKKPFVSSFAAFLTRAHDQFRMAQYSDPNMVVCGSHAGVSIGVDGPSQMGLEDLAMMRAIHGSVVLYPSDAIACERLVECCARHRGLSYLRTTRGDTPHLYTPKTKFVLGGSHVLRQSADDRVTVVAAGITVHQALIAYEELRKKKIFIRIIDCYSVKPLDLKTLKKAADQTRQIIVVEDHYPEGGLGEAVASALPKTPMTHLAVRRLPRSGQPQQLLDFEEIGSAAILKTIQAYL